MQHEQSNKMGMLSVCQRIIQVLQYKGNTPAITQREKDSRSYPRWSEPRWEIVKSAFSSLSSSWLGGKAWQAHVEGLGREASGECRALLEASQRLSGRGWSRFSGANPVTHPSLRRHLLPHCNCGWKFARGGKRGASCFTQHGAITPQHTWRGTCQANRGSLQGLQLHEKLYDGVFVLPWSFFFQF